MEVLQWGRTFFGSPPPPPPKPEGGAFFSSLGPKKEKIALLPEHKAHTEPIKPTTQQVEPEQHQCVSVAVYRLAKHDMLPQVSLVQICPPCAKQFDTKRIERFEIYHLSFVSFWTFTANQRSLTVSGTP